MLKNKFCLVISKNFLTFANVMTQGFELNKKRVERLGLTCHLTDDEGKVHRFQDGYEYVEIGGLKWAVKNVGAEKETDGGLYFQWGDVQGYTADQVGDDAARFHMGSSWRMPTEKDFRILLASTTNEGVINYKGSGVNGRLLTSKADSSKKLFFPSCGYCYNGNVEYVGSYGFYWSNSLPSLHVVYRYNLYFDGGNCFVGSSSWVYGFSVRGVFK